MVWTGLHGLIGIGIAFATKGRTILGEVGTRTMRFGIVWGSLIPDVDLLISIIIIAAGGNMQQALAPHRTLTHSFFTILAIALIGLLLWKTALSKSVGGGLFGIAIGMFAHVLFDLPYEVGVSFFWPLVFQRFGLFWSLPGIWAYLDQTCGLPVRGNILLRTSQPRKEVPDAEQIAGPCRSRLYHCVPSDGRM
jgi:membrane-bound metal-dependent hydrolase YbcI (DUF457 family)